MKGTLRALGIRLGRLKTAQAAQKQVLFMPYLFQQLSFKPEPEKKPMTVSSPFCQDTEGMEITSLKGLRALKLNKHKTIVLKLCMLFFPSK